MERIYPLLVGGGGEEGPTNFWVPLSGVLFGDAFFNEDPKILTTLHSTTSTTHSSYTSASS